MTVRARALVCVMAMLAATGCTTAPRSNPATAAGSSTTVSSTVSSTVSRTEPTGAGATPAANHAGPCGGGGNAPAVYDHVLWIWMENHTYNQVIGNHQAPQTTAVAGACGTATRYSSVGSPSLPNYIGATSGGTQGITDDAGPPAHPLAVDNLFRQVRASGRTERSYQEGMPGPCTIGSSGPYAVKHNPAAYYVGDTDRQACASDDVPLGSAGGGALASDITEGRLPTFAFVTPDLCHDMHDCGVATGDAWLGAWLKAILASSTYRAGHTAVFVIWDEDAPMPNVVIAPTTPTGTVSSAAFDHYSLLRTTEELLGIPLLGRAAAATSMRSAFHL